MIADMSRFYAAPCEPLREFPQQFARLLITLVIFSGSSWVLHGALASRKVAAPVGCRCGCPGGCPLPLLAGSPLAYVPSAAAWACWCCCSPAFSQIAVQVASLPCVYIAVLDASLLCKHTASCTGAVAGPRALWCARLIALWLCKHVPPDWAPRYL